MVEELQRATYSVQALDHLVYELFHKYGDFDDAFAQSISAQKFMSGWSSRWSSKDKRYMILILVLGYTGKFDQVVLGEEQIKDLILLACNSVLIYAAQVSVTTRQLLNRLSPNSGHELNINDLKFITYVIKFLTECVENMATCKQLKPLILRLFTLPSWFFGTNKFAEGAAAGDPTIREAVEKLVTVYQTVDLRITQAEEQGASGEVISMLPKSVLIWHYARFLMRHGLCEILLTVDFHAEDDLLQQRLTIAERVLELLASCSRQPTIRASMIPLINFIQLGAAMEFSPRLTRYSQFFITRFQDLLSLDDDTISNHRVIKTADNSLARFDKIGDLQRLAFTMIQNNVGDDSNKAEISQDLKFWRRIRGASLYTLCDKSAFEQILEAATLQNLLSIANRLLDPDSITYLQTLYLSQKQSREDLGPKNIAPKSLERFLTEVLLHHYFVRVDWKLRISTSAVVPNERLLWGTMLEDEPSIIEEESPLALPVLSNQYHSLSDLFMNNYELYRLEAFYEIRKDLEAAFWQIKPKRSKTSNLAKLLFGEVADVVVERLDPQTDYTNPERAIEWHGSISDPICKFEGKCQNTAIVKSSNITNAVDASDVIGEIQLDLNPITRDQSQWDHSVSSDQVIYLCCLGGISEQYYSCGDKAAYEVADGFPHAFKHPTDFAKAYNILCVRTCVVAHLNNPKDSIVGQDGVSIDTQPISSNIRSYTVKFESNQYREDMAQIAAGNLPDNLYSLFNVCVRRKPEANTLSGHLLALKSLLLKPLELDDYVKPEFRDIFLGKIYQKEEDSTALLTTDFEAKLQESRPGFEYTESQKKAIATAIAPGLTLIAGPPGTGKTDVAVQIVSLLHAAPDNHKTLLIARSNYALNEFFTKIALFGVDPSRLLRLGVGEANLQIMSVSKNEREEFSAEGRVAMIENRKAEALTEIREIAAAFGIPTELVEDCCSTLKMLEFYIKPHLNFYEVLCSSMPDIRGMIAQQLRDSDIWKERVLSSAFYLPLYERQIQFWEQSQGINTPITCDSWDLLWPHELSSTGNSGHAGFLKEKDHILSLFQYVNDYYPFELFRSSNEKTQYMSTVHAEVVAMTSTRAMSSQSRLVESGFEFSTVIIEEAAQLLEIECVLSAFLQKNSKNVLKRIILLGDPMQLGPVVQHRQLRDRCKFGRSLFNKLVALSYPRVRWLDSQGRMRKELADVWRDYYSDHPVGDMDHVQLLQARNNRGFKYNLQCIDSSRSGSESESSPHHYVNVAEVEWCLALYIYMRNMGYPSSEISVLTPYSAQRDLCKKRFNQVGAQYSWLELPSRIATVDEYQGQQNNFIILSLVRSRRVGHIMEEGRAVVALSRARLGLYVILNRDLYSQSRLNHRFLNSMWRSETGGLILETGNEIKDPKSIFQLVKESRAKNITEDVNQRVDL